MTSTRLTQSLVLKALTSLLVMVIAGIGMILLVGTNFGSRLGGRAGKPGDLVQKRPEYGLRCDRIRASELGSAQGIPECRTSRWEDREC